jgi:DNA-binding PadR family transcriptional regulator
MTNPTSDSTIKPAGLPLRPLPLALLVAFAAGEIHIYGLIQQAITDVKGALTITERTVYREIPRLVTRGLIEPVANTHPQRYRLTPFGRRLLLAERAQSADRFRLLQARL